MTDLSSTADVINVSDITERVEKLREERAYQDRVNGTARAENGALTSAGVDANGEPAPGTWEYDNPDEAEELANMENLLQDLSGQGRGHKWGDDDYPSTLISDSYFTRYAEELTHDCGAVSRNASWVVIDWEATANGMKQDYRQVDYDGKKFWFRA
jgi:hypothetical protein